jgi:uncharacterized RDD family membrane protein YckC
MTSEQLSPPASTTSLKGKSFGNRTVAYIIDSAVLAFTSYGTGYVVSAVVILAFVTSGRQPILRDVDIWCFDYFVGAINFVIYFMLFEGFFGASPGKLILGMRVVQEDGSRCTFRAALERGLFRFIDGFFFGYIAYRHMSEPLYKRYGDDAAETIVTSVHASGIKEHPSGWNFVWAMLLYGVFLVGLRSVSILFLLT